MTERARPHSIEAGSGRTAGAAFVIKTEIVDAASDAWGFANQKTMYCGKRIASGDAIFVFASENEGGHGLIARGIVTSAEPTPPNPQLDRRTPRVSIAVRRTALAKRPLGRQELKRFSDWHDGRPETELNFKLYRQATNKIVGLSETAAEWLAGFF